MGSSVTYEDQVDEWIRTALRGAKTFVDIVHALPGVYPNDIAKSLQRQQLPVPLGPSEPLLRLSGPIPHPVNGDWRFHPEALDVLRSQIHRRGAKTVAILAGPSAALALWRDVERLALLDSNTAWERYLRRLPIDFRCADVSHVPTDWIGAFDFVLGDPPWYEAEFCRFLATASQIARRGALIALSWPAEGTRPGVREEQARITSAAEDLGLVVADHSLQLLRYATPFYEGRALQAAGLPVLAGWRKADLVTFSKSGDARACPAPPIQSAWRTVTYRRLTLGVRANAPRVRKWDLRLQSILSGDVLPTVSRRDSRREQAVVWTAANRIFDCSDADLLIKIVQGMAAGQNVAELVRIHVGHELTAEGETWAREAAQQIKELEAREGAEYESLHAAFERKRHHLES